MTNNATQLADQLIEYLEGGVNPLECWPLLEQLDAELDRLLGPPGEFPNCHPRLLARKITDGAQTLPTLWLLDFSVPDVDHAHQFRGTRAELAGDELAGLRAELLIAVRGWRRKLSTLEDDWVRVPLRKMFVGKSKPSSDCDKFPDKIRFSETRGVYLIRREYLDEYLEGENLKEIRNL